MTTTVSEAETKKSERAIRAAEAAAEAKVNAKHYEAERAAVLLRTARLRQERMEREAAEVRATAAKRRKPAKPARKIAASAAPV